MIAFLGGLFWTGHAVYTRIFAFKCVRFYNNKRSILCTGEIDIDTVLDGLRKEMAILADRQYTLDDFSDVIRSDDGSFDLPQATIDIINRLAKLVGAPTYQKTPVFKKRDRRPRRLVISAADWEEIRNFVPTKLEKNETGIQVEIDKIRCSLNKITSTNYGEMRDNIVDVLRLVLESDPEDEELVMVGTSIFEIGSMNKFWSKLYAELYKDLIATFAPMQEIYRKSFAVFLNLFDNIRYVSAEEDYDEFCRVNKENENRRAMSSFFLHLMKHGVIEANEILDLIESLQSKFRGFIGEEGRKNEASEIAENLVVLIGNGKEELERSDEWEGIVSFVEEIINADVSQHLSLTNQILFKFMDLEEDL